MTYRILVDENTSPGVAELLRADGHDAIHVTDALEPGVTDRRILDYAVDVDAVLLTHDDDFLRAHSPEPVSILYYADDTMAVSEIVTQVRRVIQYVPDPQNLPTVTSLGGW
ncbi:DUF5615 family PIN-like protein [Salinarchaeum laminariae]|uniref:DUF5615 family PIN-like protein n=1 Tax=Salinarchaeum laminariae TaxID=869888 RepID=UPI0020C181E8|nr:DUF5615 family PIN-like protein [Salinarchaeum laminariae]